jgi:hypothetical protein
MPASAIGAVGEAPGAAFNAQATNSEERSASAAFALRSELEGDYDRNFQSIWTGDEQSGASYRHLSDFATAVRCDGGYRPEITPAPVALPARDRLDQLARLGVLRDQVGIDPAERRRRDWRFGLVVELVAKESGIRFRVTAPNDLSTHVLAVWADELVGTPGQIASHIGYMRLQLAASSGEEKVKLEQEIGTLESCHTRHSQPMARWMSGSRPFDFTNSMGDVSAEVVNEFDDEIRRASSLARLNGGDWHPLTAGDLRRLLNVDRRIYESGTAYSDDPSSDIYVEAERPEDRARGSRCSPGEDFLAAAVELGRRDPTFWPTIRKLGPTPAMVRRARYILHAEPEHVERLLSNTGCRTVARPAVPRQRSREVSFSAANRPKGSRRGAPSRSKGGGSSDDGGGEPPGLFNALLAGNGAFFRALLCLLLLVGSVGAAGSVGQVSEVFETRGPEFRYPSMRPFGPVCDSDFPPLREAARVRAEALFEDPRRLEAQDDLLGPFHDWWCDVCSEILDRCADAYNPTTAYLCDNLGPRMAESLSHGEMLAMLRAQLDGDTRMLQSLVGRLTAANERSSLKLRSDSFDHYAAQILSNGEARIIMDQRHLSRSRAKSSPVPKLLLLRSQRTRARSRSCGVTTPRRRRSRRTPSRSAGGGSSGSDDPGGEPEPALALAISGGLDV